MRESYFFNESQNQIIVTPKLYKKIKHHLSDFVVTREFDFFFITTSCAYRVSEYTRYFDVYVKGSLSDANSQCNSCVYRLKALTGNCQERFSALQPSMNLLELRDFLYKKHYKESKELLDRYYASFDPERSTDSISLILLFVMIPLILFMYLIPFKTNTNKKTTI